MREQTIHLLGRTIEELEDAIEFYANNEGYCDDEEEAELARERKEWLLDDLVKLRNAIRNGGDDE